MGVDLIYKQKTPQLSEVFIERNMVCILLAGQITLLH